jgi:hypothetical protein
VFGNDVILDIGSSVVAFDDAILAEGHGARL